MWGFQKLHYVLNNGMIITLYNVQHIGKQVNNGLRIMAENIYQWI